MRPEESWKDQQVSDRERSRAKDAGRKYSTYHTNIPVNRGYSLVGARLQQLAGDDLFHREDYAVFTPYANGCAAVFYRFDRIFNLWTVLISLCGTRLTQLAVEIMYLKVPAIW